MKSIFVLAILTLTLGCKTNALTPDQCDILVHTAQDLAVRITLSADSEKAPLVADYAAILANIGDVGCDFVPVKDD